jgi:uncharacterized protein (DUF58 family)
MALPRRADPRSVEHVRLEDLIALRAAGESINLASARVRAAGSGGHLSLFKGRGVEYDESRPYQPGDDLRTMDWRVTARTGKPHTKVFREERNRPVVVWLDLRQPMMFATRGAYKAVRAAQTAALVAWSAVANGDRLGALVFSDAEHRELRPQLGRGAALRLFREIAAESFWKPAEAPNRAEADHALVRLTRVTRPGSLVFMLSDFRALGDDAERHLRQLGSRGDLFLLHFFDPLEAELPPPGRYRIQLGGRSLAIDTGNARLRARHRAQFEARRERLRALVRLPGVHVLECATDEDPQALLAGYFRG